ncbi:hypothetical protein SAMN05216359_102496 [Roseateles sp. YR242]|uniref:hypothetical protein n=1 Tax=Roseateles sp. YR242 TaxID=1855305 RepID=UPI0008B47FAE|nr:hypothetical protein [Roseateles sp. YR242]SEK63820.1 hypothetical protein SAMN05216359_102496 [Roseateles sp. YR242]
MTTAVTDSKNSDLPSPATLNEKLQIGPNDTEEIQAAKLRYQTSVDSQIIQGVMNSVHVSQGGPKAVGGQV